MPYPGGKSGAGIFQKIINEMPEHDLYIEPFLGDGGVLRRKRPAARTVGIEVDPETLANWRGDELPGLELYHCCGIEWLRHHFGLYRVAAAGARYGGGTGPQDPRSHNRTLVYADPPYPRACRKSAEALYRFEMTDQQHEDLLGVLIQLPCCVMVSSYHNELYDAMLIRPGWRRVTFQGMTRRGPSIEVLWMNFAPPAVLHDYRFLGANKRERERINRRVRNWAAGLRRMPAHERNAVLRAIDEVERG
jgi:hypothetical protein